VPLTGSAWAVTKGTTGSQPSRFLALVPTRREPTDATRWWSKKGASVQGEGDERRKWRLGRRRNTAAMSRRTVAITLGAVIATALFAVAVYLADQDESPRGPRDTVAKPASEITISVRKTNRKWTAEGFVSPSRPGAKVRIIWYKKTGETLNQVGSALETLNETGSFASSRPRSLKKGSCMAVAAFLRDASHQVSSATKIFKC